MECHDELLFEPWVAQWKDLVEFEIVPVHTSRDAAALYESDFRQASE
jgi:hypothetical protein